MNSDQDIIYRAIRDAWFQRLREIDITKTVRDAIQSNMPSHDTIRNDIYHAFAQTTLEVLNGYIGSKPSSTETECQSKGLAPATDDDINESKS